MYPFYYYIKFEYGYGYLYYNIYYKDPKQLKGTSTSNILPYPSQPGPLVRPVMSLVLASSGRAGPPNMEPLV